METTLQELFAAGLTESTRKTYRSGERRYLNFCATLGNPATEKHLAGFIAHLYNKGLKPSTMKGYLAAVRYGQIALGLGDLVITKMPQLQYILKGAHRNMAGRLGRTRLLVTPEILECFCQVWEKHSITQDVVMLWVASTLCFFAFLQMGEAVAPSDSGFDPRFHLAYGDVRFSSATDPSWMEVTIKRSKCDQLCKWVTLSVGVTRTPVCPVAAMSGYLVQRGGALGPLFIFADGHLLTRDRFVSAVRAILAACSIDLSSYAGHSFRVGAATTMAVRSLQDSLIQILGCWNSSAYMVYMRTPKLTLISVVRSLVS